MQQTFRLLSIKQSSALISLRFLRQFSGSNLNKRDIPSISSELTDPPSASSSSSSASPSNSSTETFLKSREQQLRQQLSTKNADPNVKRPSPRMESLIRRGLSTLIDILPKSIQNHYAEKAKADARSVAMYQNCRGISMEENLMKAFNLPETHYRSYQALFTIHLYVVVRTMQEHHYDQRSIDAAKLIFERAKHDFTADIKAIGLKYSHALYTRNTDLLLATHRKFGEDFTLAPQEVFANLMATIWTHVYEMSYTQDELQDARLREKLIGSARQMTRYLLDNLEAAAQCPEEDFFEGRLKFVPIRPLSEMNKYEANLPLNPELIKQRH